MKALSRVVAAAAVVLVAAEASSAARDPASEPVAPAAVTEDRGRGRVWRPAPPQLVVGERPVPMPRVKPAEPGAVPMPRVQPVPPGPVEMPRAGQDGTLVAQLLQVQQN